MNNRLEHRQIWMTHRGRGFGPATARQSIGEGSNVALTFIGNAERTSETAKAAQAMGGKAPPIRTDSDDAEAVVTAMERTAREPGSGGPAATPCTAAVQ